MKATEIILKGYKIYYDLSYINSPVREYKAEIIELMEGIEVEDLTKEYFDEINCKLQAKSYPNHKINAILHIIFRCFFINQIKIGHLITKLPHVPLVKATRKPRKPKQVENSIEDIAELIEEVAA